MVRIGPHRIGIYSNTEAGRFFRQSWMQKYKEVTRTHLFMLAIINFIVCRHHKAMCHFRSGTWGREEGNEMKDFPSDGNQNGGGSDAVARRNISFNIGSFLIALLPPPLGGGIQKPRVFFWRRQRGCLLRDESKKERDQSFLLILKPPPVLPTPLPTIVLYHRMLKILRRCLLIRTSF